MPAHPALLRVLNEEQSSAEPGKVTGSLVVVTMTAEHCLLCYSASCNTQDRQDHKTRSHPKCHQGPYCGALGEALSLPWAPSQGKGGRGVSSQERTLGPSAFDQTPNTTYPSPLKPSLSTPRPSLCCGSPPMGTEALWACMRGDPPRCGASHSQTRTTAVGHTPGTALTVSESRRLRVLVSLSVRPEL